MRISVLITLFITIVLSLGFVSPKSVVAMTEDEVMSEYGVIDVLLCRSITCDSNEGKVLSESACLAQVAYNLQWGLCDNSPSSGCLEGYSLVNRTCVKDETVAPRCPTDTAFVNSECVPFRCAGGFVTEGQSCVPPLSSQICWENSGDQSMWTGELNSQGGPICECTEGYVFNEWSVCVAIPPTPKPQTCQDYFGLHSVWTGEYNAEGGFLCGCGTGYEMDNDSSKCVLLANPVQPTIELSDVKDTPAESVTVSSIGLPESPAVVSYDNESDDRNDTIASIISFIILFGAIFLFYRWHNNDSPKPEWVNDIRKTPLVGPAMHNFSILGYTVFGLAVVIVLLVGMPWLLIVAPVLLLIIYTYSWWMNHLPVLFGLLILGVMVYAFANSNDSSSPVNRDTTPTFHGRPCTTADCHGHRAGYAWAEEENITNPNDCGGKSDSFIEGCEMWAEDNEGSDETTFGDRWESNRGRWDN